MTSSADTLAKVELQGAGDNPGSWHIALNAALQQMIENYRDYLALDVASADVTLTDTQYVSNQARRAGYKFTGTLAGNRVVTAPDRAAVYYLHDTTTRSGYTLTFTVNGGSSLLLSNGFRYMIYLDGAGGLRAIAQSEPSYVTASGTDTYTVTMEQAPTAYYAGLSLNVVFTNANTGAATVNVNSLGAKNITKNGSTAVVSGDIAAGSVHRLIYDGTQFQLEATNVAGLGQGTWERWIPSTSMWPASTNGAEYGVEIEVAATQPTLYVAAFDASTKEYMQFAIRWSKSLGTATFTFIPIWTHPSTTTNFGVVWSLQTLALSNDDNLATAFGTAQTSTDTGGTTHDVYIGPASSAITPSNTPAESDLYWFQIAREVSDGSDTMAVDAYLIGVVLVQDVGAANDA